MSKISELTPREVFSRFDDICRIPHGSGNTGEISDYLVKFAAVHGLKYRQEPCGNVIIFKEASPGYEDAGTVMLQGHMDMVAVKTEDCSLDLEREHILPAVTKDGEWIYAKDTSLGGDDGIALAMALAILEDDSLSHPALEAVFTVDEEIGLLGAAALDVSDLKSRILLNMDSEEDGVFLTSCAGGATVKCLIPAERQLKSGIIYQFQISGLRGGHSGSDAHLEQANANVLLGRFLAMAAESCDFSLADLSGGEKDNAIPISCSVTLMANDENGKKLENAAEDFNSVIIREYATKEPDLKVSFRCYGSKEAPVLTSGCAVSLIRALELLPSGLQRRMPDIPDMVQTSLNLGVLRLNDNEASMTYSVRSSSGSEKDWLIKRMSDLMNLVGGRTEVDGDYPAWEYIPGSRIQRIMSETYEEISGKKPQLAGIHAGVECGILAEKLPGLDCISYGPQMHDIHTVRERLNIASVGRTYELTLRVLERLN